MAKKLLSIVCVLQLWVMVIGDYRLNATPTPALDDETHLMLPCFSYLYQGSEYATPNGQCCSGFKKLLDKNAEGICDFINQAETYGLEVKRILGLPDACHITYAINCPGSPTPTPPTPTPSSQPPSKPSPTPSPQAPSPPADCTAAMANIAPCFGYLQKGSSVPKPDATCCNGFKQVLKDNPGCVCVGVKAAPGFGLDVERILGLPSACGVSYTIDCSTPSPSPPETPVPSPSPPKTPTPSPQPPPKTPSPPAPPKTPPPPPKSSPNTPPPPPDCYSVLFWNMHACATYVTIGSNDTTPSERCCNGFKDVLTINADCICSAVRHAAEHSFDVNRILGLPAACSSSYVLDCAPSPSPPETPVPSPSPPKAPIPSPQPPPKTPSPPPPPESSPNTPPPPPDCYSVLFWNMHACATYVTIGSNDTTPSERCCNGFKDVLTINADCICSAVRHAAEHSFDVNRILGLPAACSSSYVLDCCEENCPPPTGSPAIPPAPAPAPASTPPKSGTAALSSSISYLGIGFTLATLGFCYY